jgi:hypothetical protein
MAWFVPEEGTSPWNDQFLYSDWNPEHVLFDPVAPCIWHIDPLTNSGYPYCDLMIGIPKLRIKIVDQEPYINVYDVTTERDGFNSNGLAILCPTECRVHQVDNGEYSVRMRHPMDDAGKWEYLRERNYLKILGQIYTIISVDTDFTNHFVDVYAEHVFYQLNDAFIFAPVYSDERRYVSGDNGQEIINDIMVSATYYSPPPYKTFAFQYYSDIPIVTFQLDIPDGGMTPVQAMLGGGGMCEVTGGHLFRDNFYFSICETMEDSDENAFDIRVGNNLHGITRKIDTSTMATYFRGDDGLGDWVAYSYGSEEFVMQVLPHNIVRAARFPTQEMNYPLLCQLTASEFARNFSPIISYKFDIRDSIADDTYADIEKMYRYEVGDSGYLYDERLGGRFKLTITETEKDGITGRTLSFTVGNTRSFTRSGSAPPADVPAPRINTKSYLWRDKNGVILVDKNGATLYTEEAVTNG